MPKSTGDPEANRLHEDAYMINEELEALEHTHILDDSPSTPAFSAGETIERRHPAIVGAFGFIDGLHVPVEVSSDPQEEQATYNGWLHSHQIGNIFVFAPDGKHNRLFTEN